MGPFFNHFKHNTVKKKKLLIGGNISAPNKGKT